MFVMVLIAFGVGYAVVLTEPEDFTDENTPTIIGGIFFYTFFQVNFTKFQLSSPFGQSLPR